MQLETALKDAMRAQDDLRKRTLRMALSAIHLAEIESKQEQDDPAVMAALQKEIKTRQESVEEAKKANRPELAAATQAEIEVLQSFLPQPFSPAELEALVREAVAEVGATSAREIGPVMKILMPRLQGRATGSEANQVLRRLLG
ncbi:MAG TPA: GatB/YqeY domain-containing protein [Anaerolineales bacterium]|nr:GatB/YqeY domain-containing protein [Anaerolineales bacterium]